MFVIGANGSSSEILFNEWRSDYNILQRTYNGWDGSMAIVQCASNAYQVESNCLLK